MVCMKTTQNKPTCNSQSHPTFLPLPPIPFLLEDEVRIDYCLLHQLLGCGRCWWVCSVFFDGYGHVATCTLVPPAMILLLPTTFLSLDPSQMIPPWGVPPFTSTSTQPLPVLFPSVVSFWMLHTHIESLLDLTSLYFTQTRVSVSSLLALRGWSLPFPDFNSLLIHHRTGLWVFTFSHLMEDLSLFLALSYAFSIPRRR